MRGGGWFARRRQRSRQVEDERHKTKDKRLDPEPLTDDLEDRPSQGLGSGKEIN
jgi:hypothetical protein